MDANSLSQNSASSKSETNTVTQTRKHANAQTRKRANAQTRKRANAQTRKRANAQTHCAFSHIAAVELLNVSVNRHAWTVYVKSIDNSSLPMIESVQFTLHPSFRPSHFVFDSEPFALRRIGWGSFVIPIVIKFTSLFGGMAFKVRPYSFSASSNAFKLAHQLELSFGGASQLYLLNYSTGEARAIQNNDKNSLKTLRNSIASDLS
jgi:hypothetical protein